MSSGAQTEFEWKDENSFINIISALFNNWPVMTVVVQRALENSNDVYPDIREFIHNVFDFLVTHGTSCSDLISGIIIKSMKAEFDVVIEDFAGKEMSTRICNIYDKWIKQNNSYKKRKQVIKEIKNSPKPNPIVEFENLPGCRFSFETKRAMY